MQLGWNCKTRNVECWKIFASKKIFEGHVILKYWITSCCERRRVTHAKTFLKTSSDWNKMTSISGILLKLREKYGYGSTKAKALMSFHSFLCSSKPLCCKLFELMSCVLSLDLPPLKCWIYLLTRLKSHQSTRWKGMSLWPMVINMGVLPITFVTGSQS